MAKKRKIEIKHEPVSEPEPEEQEEAPLYEDDDQNEESEEQEEEQQQPETAVAVDDEGGEGDASGDGSGEASEDENEPVHKLLEPFSKEQLIDLLVEASTNHPDVLDRVTKIADVDPVHRKIFVHGLGWDTTSETLTSVFTKYGEIEECKAVVDKISGKSKGYGFILFKHRKGARKALVEPQKRIGSRMTACQLASAGPVPPPMPAASEYTQRKIFVSNVSADIDPHKLASYFAKYGEIEEGPLGLDKQTGKPKGFALFVYKSVESSRKALEEPHKNFEGHILHCQKAIDGPKPNKTHSHQHMNTHHHGGSHRNDNPNFMGGGGGGVGNQMSAVNVMNPPQSALPFNQGAPQVAGVNPLSQAVAALLASQGTGFGLTNLLGTLGSQGMTPQVNQNTPVPMGNNPGAGMQGGYGNQQNMGGYGTPTPIQGGYSNQSVGQQSTGRPQQGMGHVAGPYMGH